MTSTEAAVDKAWKQLSRYVTSGAVVSIHTQGIIPVLLTHILLLKFIIY